MEPLRAVLFDLDGTLLDPNGSIRATIDAILDEEALDAIPAAEVMIGMPLRDILRRRTQDDAQIERMVRRYRDVFGERSWRRVRFYPGTQDVVERARGAGLRTAVVTTKGEGEAVRLLEDLGVAGLFDAVVGDDDHRPLKPDPAPVAEALRRLGVPAGQAVMVGDTVYDVAAGRGAGCRTIGVLWGHGTGAHGPHGADLVVRDAAQLRDIIDAWARDPA